MSRMKIYLAIVNHLNGLAENIADLAGAMESVDSVSKSNEATTQKDEQPTESAPDPDQAPVITEETLREVVKNHSLNGKTSKVKALLAKFNAGKVSEVKEEDYEAFLAEAVNLK